MNKHLIEQIESNLLDLDRMSKLQRSQLATLEGTLEDLDSIDWKVLSEIGKLTLEFRMRAVESKIDDGKDRLASILELYSLSKKAIELLNLEDLIAENPDKSSEKAKTDCRDNLKEVLKLIKATQDKLAN